jgi:hypothetical protein
MSTRQRHLNPAEQNAVLESVTTLLIHRLPGDWEQVLLDVRMVGSHVETPVTLLTIFGRSIRWELPDEALRFFLELRAGMYRPEWGTWCSLRYHLAQTTSRYSVEYDWKNEPDWTHRPSERFFAEELDRFPRPAENVPEWLRERAGRSPADGPGGTPTAEPAEPGRTPAAGLYEAPVFDGLDEQGGPVIDRPPVHPQDRDEILEYLEGAPVVLAARGYGQDAFDPDSASEVPLTFHTDGTWLWSGATPYYFRRRHVPPVPQLVKHIRDRGYRSDAVEEAAMSAAASVATGQKASLPLPGYRPRVISEADRLALEDLRTRLERYGVAPHEYGILDSKPDALVIEPAPDKDGWQLQFWDSDRGPTGRPKVFPDAAGAAGAMLAALRHRGRPTR